MKNIIVFAAALSLCAAASVSCETDRNAALNAAAAKEYLTPIRPHTEGRNPNWTGFCKKFTYAPVFDFQEIDGAVKYRFTVTPDIAVNETVARADDDGEAQSAKTEKEAVKLAENSYSFVADTPDACLSPIWAEIPVGKVVLKVEALDKAGNVIGVAGERSFLRDFPFEGPYPGNVRPYREAALMAMLYINSMPQIQHWAESSEIDLTYHHNTYVNKVVGNTVSVEAKMAMNFPDYAEEAIPIAKGAAQFLIDQSRPEGDVLEFFPPSYYGQFLASKHNDDMIMTMDPCYSANGFLAYFRCLIQGNASCCVFF